LLSEETIRRSEGRAPLGGRPRLTAGKTGQGSRPAREPDRLRTSSVLAPSQATTILTQGDGSKLECCGYLGGALGDSGHGIALDAAHNAVYVTGFTTSPESSFPVLVGPDVSYNSPVGNVFDAFVAKLSLFATLQASGSPRPGGRVALTLAALYDASLSYQVGSSLGTGPIPIDIRKIALSPDWLLTVSVAGWWPSVFSGYRGLIDSKGQAQATIHIPNVPALIGLRLDSAFVTLDPRAPSGIRSISNTETFTIAK
jgi:hypothetical protein